VKKQDREFEELAREYEQARKGAVNSTGKWDPQTASFAGTELHKGSDPRTVLAMARKLNAQREKPASEKAVERTVAWCVKKQIERLR
jgi:hypothetical protein